MPNISGNPTALTGDVWTASKVNAIQNALSQVQINTSDPAASSGDLNVRSDLGPPELRFYQNGSWWSAGKSPLIDITSRLMYR